MEPGVKKIIPNLWFDKEAEQAVSFYSSVFKNSQVVTNTRIEGTPSGSVDIITFKLSGQEFMAINAGPMFRFNQSISFFVYCGSESEIDRIYDRLCEDGSVLMPLGKYDWTGKYAWVKDKFGLSWQLDIDDINSQQKIVPALLFANEKSGRVKEAVEYYNSIFPESRVILEAPFDKSSGFQDDRLLFAQFSLSKFLFNTMSSPLHHDFDFNEAVSFMIYCDTQKDIDYFWEKLTDGGAEQPCGWVKDKFGVSWQIVPFQMNEMMATKDPVKLARVTEAMLKMMKLDIKILKKAFDNK